MTEIRRSEYMNMVDAIAQKAEQDGHSDIATELRCVFGRVRLLPDPQTFATVEVTLSPMRGAPRRPVSEDRSDHVH